ncbi:hypothetical protein [Propionibacterium sp. oral taxon 192]|uniref:hypothetical protein n=1 Tax=Propionibacterium sp. oral taxon 192 TaxID=671222 RepID=UPI0012EBD171|nr:hypothetical protein [Propionibacterium sp. oral taxon 192]
MVDELAAVVGVDLFDREREAKLQLLRSGVHSAFAFAVDLVAMGHFIACAAGIALR